MANKPVNQHWVPQFYLREFSTPETRNTECPQVWIFSKFDSDGDEKPTNVRNVCAKRYLYSPRDESGLRSWEVDDDLQDVEGLLGQIWAQVASDFIDLSNESVRKALSLFVATTYFRHPDNQRVFETGHQRIVEAFDNLPKKADGSPDIHSISYQGKQLEIDTSNWQSYKKWGKDEHHRFFAEMIREESGNLAKMLLKKRWSIVFADKESFITSDKPVGVRHLSKETFGIGTVGAMISFPLSPTRMLIMDDQHHEPANQYYPLMTNLVGAFNHSIWHGCSRFMITGRPVHEVLYEIVNYGDAALNSGD